MSQELMQMRCAWQELLSILPLRLRTSLHQDQNIQEIRLRLGLPPELVTAGGSRWLSGNIKAEDLSFCINAASRYSPWNASGMAQGFLTAPGGHRIGICGQTVIQNGHMTGFREIRSLCIRVARDFPGLAAAVGTQRGSILIIGAPGWGKTTLLRDLIRQISDGGEPVSVIDQREELFPACGVFLAGKCTDILYGCPKEEGIDAAIRTMGPAYIAVDEITAPADCQALLRAGWCGVKLLATAHAGSMEELRTRTVYRPLLESKLFSTVLVLNRDKSWSRERIA